MFNKQVDVLLINPFCWAHDRPSYLPYGILFLASYLRQRDITVALLDQNTSKADVIEDVIKKCNPRIVGLSVLTGPVIRNTLDISREIKKHDSGIVIVWGGIHPTIFPENVLREKSVDYIILGEGEEAFYELVTAVLNQKETYAIQNLGFARGDQCIINPMRQTLINLNDVGMPAWDLLDISKYVMNKFYANRVLTMNTSRGCPFKCAFCWNQALPFQRWRAVDAQHVFEQMMFLKENYRINGIQYFEDSFDTDKRRVRQLSQLLIDHKAGMKWDHSSNIPYFDASLLKLEKAAGCRHIGYGVESGSDRMLRFMNKKQTVEDVKAVFEGCRKIGIHASPLFMIGLPTETEDDLKQTIDLVESLPAHLLICTMYRPYPGTPLYDYCVKHNKFNAPNTVEEQAEFYRFSHMGAKEMNLSEVPTEKLMNLQRSIFAKVAINELILSLKERNFELIFYYIKQQVHWKNFVYTFRALIARALFLFKFMK